MGVKAFKTLDDAGREALAGELEELLESLDASGDGTLVVPSEYLKAVTIRR
jgi:hypothetical protein